jgi:hypothetical protein
VTKLLRPLSLGGTAVVVCLHNREKRVVNTPDDVAQLGVLLDPPVIFDPKVHKVHICACCSNLFVDRTDSPRYCSVCDPNKPFTHMPAAPLAQPIGVWNG